MNKKIKIVIAIIGCLLLLWICGIRIHMPFSTMCPRNWESLEITNYIHQTVKVTDDEDIERVKELVFDLPVTTCGFAPMNDESGFVLKINSKAYEFSGSWFSGDNWFTSSLKYSIPAEKYFEQLKQLHMEFMDKYGLKSEISSES